MKKTNKILNIAKKPITILNIFAVAFLVYSIYLINGVENQLRLLVIIDIILINSFILFLLNSFLSKNKVKNILFLTVVLIINILEGFLGLYIYRIYAAIDKMNTDSVTYETVAVTLKNENYTTVLNIKDTKIGIIEDETSIDGNILPTEIIKNNNLSKNNQIIKYDSISNLISALYNKEVDIIFTSNNYTIFFSENELYKNINTDTKVIYNYEKKYTKNEIAKLNKNTEQITSNASIDKPFTVLLMGIDVTTEVLDKNATGNGDSLILLTFNPKTLNITMVSIPRDSYVPIACFPGQKENKITHAGWNGETCMMKTIQNFTGITIDYYAKINFKGLVKLVDTLGGIEIDSPFEFCITSNSDRKLDNICIKKGIQTLDGEQALGFARERYSFATADLQRGLNQQTIVKAILNKLKTVRSATDALNILNTISTSIATNFTTDEILSFYNIFKEVYINSGSNVEIEIDQMFLYGEGQGIYDESMEMVLSNYILNQSSLKQVINAMKINLEINDAELIKNFNFNIEEKYEKQVIGKNPSSGTKKYSTLPDFVGATEAYTTSWLISNEVTYEIKYTSETNEEEGIVLNQSIPAYKRLDLIGETVVITVSKPIETPINNDTNNNEEEKETTQKEEESPSKEEAETNEESKKEENNEEEEENTQ